MKNEIQSNIPPVQPLSLSPIPVSPSNNWSKILLFIILGLMTVAGLVFIGIEVGRGQALNQRLVAIQPTVLQTYINVMEENLSLA
jgi:hypothetical protein